MAEAEVEQAKLMLQTHASEVEAMAASGLVGSENAARLQRLGEIDVAQIHLALGLAVVAGLTSGLGINTGHELGHKKSKLERTLAKIQQLDPVGIGARTLSESIVLQLSQLDWETPGLQLALEIAGEHLDLVATRDYGELRRGLRVTEDDLQAALALIRGCNPRPGNAVSPPAAEYVIPDVFVRKIDNKWQVEISPTGVPRLSVNQQYARLLRGSGEHAVLKTQLQEARWLIRSLEIRNETLLKVATSIVARQADFLEQGEEAMKPMVLRDIAEEIGMHESTISRVTTNKYMHTPRGIFEFKYFFSSHLSSESGEDQSSTSVRAKIRKLINTENPAKPLSDSKITNLLKEEGISVARRTVAKYREAMNIPSSSERRIREPRS